MKAKWKALVLAACIALEGVTVSAAGQEPLDELIVSEAETEIIQDVITVEEDTINTPTQTFQEDSDPVQEILEMAEQNEEETVLEISDQPDVVTLDDEEGIVETFDFSDWIIRTGGFPGREFPTGTDEETDVLQASSATEATFKSVVYTALKNRETTIDVSYLHIEKKRAGELYLDVLNGYPELFYVGSITNYSHDGYCMRELYPQYVYSEGQVKQVEEKAKQILAGMNKSWAEERKLMYLHDYLVMNCAYDYSYNNYNLYNALMEGSAVCQGYADAYAYLAMKAGIVVDVVSSMEINHAWNMVDINGKNYFIDATWDDLAKDKFFVYGDYTYFLKSKTAFDHQGSDWYCPRCGNVNSYGYNATEYDHAFWENCLVPTPYVQDTAAYIKSDDPSGIVLHYSNGTEKKVNFPTRFYWPVYNDTGYYDRTYIFVVSTDECFCINSADTIYGVSPSGDIWPIYSLNESEKKQGYIYGLLKSSIGGLSYLLGQSYETIPIVKKEVPASIIREGKGILIDDTAFPDPAFRNVVRKFDTSNSGVLSLAEMDAVTWINCSSAVTGASKITSLKGIENFKNLTGLNCSGQSLSSLDVSIFPNLGVLACDNNNLRSLDVSKNLNLQNLYCSNNKLSNLTIGANSTMTELLCNNNELKNLDIEKCTKLKATMLRGQKTELKDSTGAASVYSISWSDKGENRILVYDKKTNVKYGTRFLDVLSDKWYVSAVDYAFDEGIMNGTGDMLFAPEMILTREQFVTVLYNHSGKPKTQVKAPFSDVPADEWYTAPIAWAFTRDITSGVGEGKFGVGQDITREQLVTMLYSYAQFCELDTSFSKNALDDFGDTKKVSSWAKDAMKWGVTKGVISGKPGKNGAKANLDPQGKATRAECAQMMKNLIEKNK